MPEEDTFDIGELRIRTSERTSFARCRQQWFWAYRDCLTPLHVKPALRFGDLIHQSLAAYYKPSRVRTRVIRGPHPAETFQVLYNEQLQKFSDFGMYTEEGEWEEAYSLGTEMLENYIKRYGKDEQFQVIKPEVSFQVDVYDDEGWYVCTYVGQFDAVIIDLNTNRLGLFEHKTAKAIRTSHLALDEQAGSYWAFAPYVMDAKDLPKMDFILYNFLRKGKEDERPTSPDGYALNKPKKEALLASCAQLGLEVPKATKVEDLIVILGNHDVDPTQLGEISKTQPSPLFHREIVRRSPKSGQSVMLRVQQQAEEIAWIDSGQMNVWKTPTRDCSWQCDFFDMCVLHENGQDWEGYRDTTMTTWDPYEAHNDHPEESSE